MKRIEKLTDEQKAQFPVWVRKWIDIGLRTGEMDLKTFSDGAESAYGYAKLGWHNNIVVVPNPLVMCLAAPIAGHILQSGAVRVAVGDAVDDAVRDAVGGAVRVAVGVAVGGAVNDAVGVAVDDAVRVAVGDAVRVAVGSAVNGAVNGAVYGAVGVAVSVAVNGAVYGAVDGAVDDAVSGAIDGAVRVAVGGVVSDVVGAEIKNNWHKYLGGQFWVGGWYWGNAYVTFFRDVCGLELSADILGRMKAYEQINTSACMWHPHEKFIMVSERPREIHLTENRLHNPSGPSIAWEGFELYHWHGVAIPKEWITDKSSITPAMALTWTNVEQRRAACEIVGWANVLEQIKAKVIDADDDAEIGTLLEADIPDSGKERFLVVTCGTGRTGIVLPVPRTVKTALEAQCWMWQVDEYKPEVRT